MDETTTGADTLVIFGLWVTLPSTRAPISSRGRKFCAVFFVSFELCFFIGLLRRVGYYPLFIIIIIYLFN
jgi:hypothetical protein